jgi:hypothetical protein
VQAGKFVRAHGGVHNDISVFGQESVPTTWRLTKMNLALQLTLLGGERGELDLPGADPVAVEATAVGADQQPIPDWVTASAHGVPPAAQGLHRNGPFSPLPM